MATSGISNYSVGGAAPLNRVAQAERPRETESDVSPPPRPSTVVEISPQARELARAAEAEERAQRENNSESNGEGQAA